jgi:hypothetical protein
MAVASERFFNGFSACGVFADEEVQRRDDQEVQRSG